MPPPSSFGRLSTAQVQADGAARPMTAVRAAGYSSVKGKHATLQTPPVPVRDNYVIV